MTDSSANPTRQGTVQPTDRASWIEADNKRDCVLGEVLQPRSSIFGILSSVF